MKLGAEKVRERPLEAAVFLMRADGKLVKNDTGGYLGIDRELLNEMNSDRWELEPGLKRSQMNCSNPRGESSKVCGATATPFTI